MIVQEMMSVKSQQPRTSDYNMVDDRFALYSINFLLSQQAENICIAFI